MNREAIRALCSERVILPAHATESGYLLMYVWLPLARLLTDLRQIIGQKLDSDG